ncbi:DNA mismatch repair protein Msh3-like [Glandiceps talaboti]
MPKPNLGKLRKSSGDTSSPASSASDTKTQVTLSRFFSPCTSQKKESTAGQENNIDAKTSSSGTQSPERHIKTVKVHSPFRKRSSNDDSQTPVSKKAKLEKDSPPPAKVNQGLEGTPSTSSKVSISSDTLSKLGGFSASSGNTSELEKTSNQTIRQRSTAASSAESKRVSLNRRTSTSNGNSGNDDAQSDSQDDMEIQDQPMKAKVKGIFGVESKSRGKIEGTCSVKASRSKSKYTPLEVQFMEIKEQYPHSVLFVECGYKYRFFGEDAQIAAKELNIFCHLDHNFMTASIPVHRLFVHVTRLVSAGYKVGVVKQTETAALKAAGDNKSGPFTRKLTALYTKSTLIGEDVDPSSSCSHGDDMSNSYTDDNYLMCVAEVKSKTAKPDNVHIGLVAVQPATGDIIYDEFEDNNSRSELETRISHIQPVELLLPMTLSENSEKIINTITASCFRKEDRIRVERIEDDIFEYNSAFQAVSDFYHTSQTTNNPKASKLQEMVNLPRPVISCLSALMKYLQEFNLEKVLKLTSNVKCFSTQARHMKLNACTLKNLEVFKNETDGGSKGTLCRILDHTVTRFGQRLLRKWIAQPLLNISEIEERLGAIHDILQSGSQVITKVKELLVKIPDIEKGLCSIYHKKSSTAEFVSVSKTLSKLVKELHGIQGLVQQDIKSSLLKTLLTEIPVFLDNIQSFTNAINEQAARDGDKTKLFADEEDYPRIKKRKKAIQDVLDDLEKHRREIRLTIRNPSFDYTTVNGQEFLIEVKNAHLKLVPDNWTKISYTKAVSRFHSPYIVESFKNLCQLREQLQIDCQDAWMDFLESFGENYHTYKKAVQHLASLDCLYSLSAVAKQDGYCRPSLLDRHGLIHIQDGRHPVVDALLGEQEQYVPNSTQMDVQGKQCMIITGPNMGGKSSYIKQVAVIVLMAHIGSYVPATSADIGVFDAIYTRMGASDNICQGNSTFMVELQEASEILSQATDKSLVILDELGRGTSTHDGMAIAYATLHHIVKEVRCLTLFVTHYPSLAELEQAFPDNISNHHMSFLVHDDKDDNQGNDVDVITFLYQLVPGAAARSYGLNVARLADIPKEILQVAAKKSKELEDAVISKRGGLDEFVRLWTSTEETIKTVLQDTDDTNET